ncbi:MAG: hypothetical protein NVSMB13_04310 [Mycobacteriales bacterium]
MTVTVTVGPTVSATPTLAVTPTTSATGTPRPSGSGTRTATPTLSATTTDGPTPARVPSTECRTATNGTSSGPAQQAPAGGSGSPGDAGQAGAISGGNTSAGGTSAGGTSAGGSQPGSAQSVEQAQQQLLSARTALAATVLTAPLAAVVTAVNVVVGAIPSTPALVLRSTGLDVSLPVAEQDAPYVTAGQLARAVFPALGVTADLTVAGAPLVATPAPSAAGGRVVTYPVLLAIAEPPAGLLPGMSVQVRMTVATRTAVIAVPTGALQSSGDGLFVRTLVAGRPEQRAVGIGLSTTAMTEITSGLEQGELVVTGVRSGTATG